MKPDPIDVAGLAAARGDAWGAMLVLEQALEREPGRRDVRELLADMQRRLPADDLQRHAAFRSLVRSAGYQPGLRSPLVRAAILAVLALALACWVASHFLVPRQRYEGVATLLFAGLGLAVLAWAWWNRINLRVKDMTVVATERPLFYHAFLAFGLLMLLLVFGYGWSQVF